MNQSVLLTLLVKRYKIAGTPALAITPRHPKLCRMRTSDTPLRVFLAHFIKNVFIGVLLLYPSKFIPLSIKKMECGK